MLRLLVVLVSCLALASAADKAIVVLSGSSGVKGTVTFTETSNGVLIEGQIEGLTAGKHGFHIHALGDLSNGCTSTGAHFNPENATHGAPNATVRHVGDLGNIEANSQGIANISYTDKNISLSGKNSILGRGVVVHEDEDDLGLGGHELSLSTGNAGARLACGVIGILEEDESDSSTATKLTTSSLALTLLLTLSTVSLKN